MIYLLDCQLACFICATKLRKFTNLCLKNQFLITNLADHYFKTMLHFWNGSHAIPH